MRGVIAGAQLTLGLEPGNPRLPFVVASLILSLTVVPVALTKMATPAPDEQRLLGMRALYTTSPLGLVGVVCTGFMLGAFYTMAPIHAQRIGLSNLETASLIGIVIAGGITLQYPPQLANASSRLMLSFDSASILDRIRW